MLLLLSSFSRHRSQAGHREDLKAQKLPRSSFLVDKSTGSYRGSARHVRKMLCVTNPRHWEAPAHVPRAFPLNIAALRRHEKRGAA